ncbi:MAG: hypothetical protein JXA57_16425 [Armatimonadetes bacterium]|nr:hypothetical protein [Armatimonadota bacterium]
MSAKRSSAPLDRILELAAKEYGVSEEEAAELIGLICRFFTAQMRAAGHDRRQIVRITTKFRDAGRRSPPWRPTSKRVPGRPQDGADGNRINRWLLPADHKFYADQVTATLTEVKYYLQALSMQNAPALPPGTIQHAFDWMIEQPVEPGAYSDPIQLIPIDLHEIVDNARLIQSGHYVPLDRGGRHEPKNAFLMLAQSNQLQGNLTVSELLQLMRDILARHDQRRASSGSAAGAGTLETP